MLAVRQLLTNSLFLLVAAYASVEAYLVQGGEALIDIDDAKAKELLAGGSSANATRSVKFKPFAGLTDVPTDLQNEEWTWRINVTDVAVPDAKLLNEQTLASPHLVSETFDFSWPGGGGISPALNGSTLPFCAVTAMEAVFPANVSNLYGESNTNSVDCGPVLGEKCVNAMIGSFRQPTQNSCDGVQSWAALPECASTLGFAYSQSSNRRETLATADLNGNQRRDSAEAFWGELTGGFNGNNTVGFLRAANTLKVMMFKTSVASGGRNVGTTQVLCMRVLAGKIDDPMLAGNGTGSGSGEDGGDPGKNGGGRHSPLSWLTALSFVFCVILSLV